MATLADWDKEVSRMPDSRVRGLLKAIVTLENWEMFAYEFDRNSIHTLRVILEIRLKQGQERFKELYVKD